MHHFHNPRGCTAQDITDILDRIPKKIGGKLEHRFGAVGYGMHAVPSWAFWKVLVALAVCSLGLWYSLSVGCVGILVSCRMLLLYQHT